MIAYLTSALRFAFRFCFFSSLLFILVASSLVSRHRGKSGQPWVGHVDRTRPAPKAAGGNVSGQRRRGNKKPANGRVFLPPSSPPPSPLLFRFLLAIHPSIRRGDGVREALQVRHPRRWRRGGPYSPPSPSESLLPVCRWNACFGWILTLVSV